MNLFLLYLIFLFGQEQVLIESDNREFDYVIRKQEQRKICFGSGQPRDTFTRSGMTLFMRRHVPEDFPNVGPAKYNVSEAFRAIADKPSWTSYSKRGYSGLGRFGTPICRNDDFPAPGDYTLPSSTSCARVKTREYPFTSTARRKTVTAPNNNPGPGTYENVDPIERRILFEHSFGGRVKMKLGVEVKCCKRNTDICDICGEKPIGDYWHSKNRIFLCRVCMVRERESASKCTGKRTRLQLAAFRKVRDCSRIHLHEGTDARVWVVHPGKIDEFARKEAYLCSYIAD